MESCNLQAFIEAIENEGCYLRYTSEEPDFKIYSFVSKNGKTAEQIIDDGENLEKEVALKHLEKLEVFYLSEQFFPRKENRDEKNISEEYNSDEESKAS